MLTLPKGRAGTRKELKELRRAIRKDSSTPLLVRAARMIVQGVPSLDSQGRRNKAGEAQAIYDFADRAIRYTEDENGNGTLVWPREVVETYDRGARTSADCVTQTALVAALGKTLNFPVRLRVIGEDGQFGHVHPELMIYGEWKAADVTATTAENSKIRELAELGYEHPASLVRYYSV